MTHTGIADITTEPVVVDRSPELARAPEVTVGGFFGEILTITEDDIAAGQRGDGTMCAIARAITRAHPDWTVCLEGENPAINGRAIALGRGITEWVGRYDRGEPVRPLIFQLDGVG